MDDAFWYGTTMSLKGRHSRAIAAWQDAYEEAEDAVREWRSTALSEKERAERLLNLNDQMIAFIKKMGDRLDVMEEIGRKALEMDQALKKFGPRYKDMKASKRLEEIKARVEEGQKEQFRTIFRLLLDYVPGLDDDLRGGGIGILAEGMRAYEATLRKRGITVEMLAELKANGYGFSAVSDRFGNPAPGADDQMSAAPSRKFVSPAQQELRTKYNDLVSKYNDLSDERLATAYLAALNKAEAEGHKAAFELARRSSPDTDIDAPNPEIPAPEGECDSPVSAAFRQAYVSHLLGAGATREALLEFAADNAYEFPFPVLEYMDWVSAQPRNDVADEGSEGPKGPR